MVFTYPDESGIHRQVTGSPIRTESYDGLADESRPVLELLLVIRDLRVFREYCPPYPHSLPLTLGVQSKFTLRIDDRAVT